MSSEPLTKAQSDVRAAHRLHHIEILAKLAADPGNPRRRTHADELHRVQVAQRAYENEKAQGHPSSQSLPVGVNKPSLLGRLGQPSHSSSWGHDGRIGHGGRRFGQRAGVRDDDRHRPQSPSAYYGGAPYPDSIPVTIGTGHSAINALRSDGARVISPTWAGAQALTILTSSGWRDVWVQVTIMDSPLTSAPPIAPPAPSPELSAAIRNMIQPAHSRNRDTALTSPMRYAERPSVSRSARGDKEERSSSSSHRWRHDKSFLDSTGVRPLSRSRQRHAAAQSAPQPEEVVKPSRRVGTGPIHPSSMDLVPRTWAPRASMSLAQTAGMASAHGATAGGSTAPETEAAGSKIVNGLASPVFSQPSLEAPASLFGSEELEECPSEILVDAEPRRITKRKRSATPELAEEERSLEERPLARKRVRRQLC